MALGKAIIRLVITGESAQFVASVKAIEARLGQFKQKVAGTFVGLGAGFAGLFAARRITGFLSDVTKEVGALAETAEALGLTVQQLDALRLAGELTGNSVEEIDTALRFFLKTLGEAKAGTRGQIDAFKQAGIEGRDLADLYGTNLFTAIGRVSDRLRRFNNVEDQAAAATGLFGRAGSKLLLFLREGSTGLAEMERTTRELQPHLDTLSATKLDAIDDEFTKLKRSVRDVGTTLVDALGPPAIAILEKFAGAVKNISGMTQRGTMFDRKGMIDVSLFQLPGMRGPLPTFGIPNIEGLLMGPPAPSAEELRARQRRRARALGLPSDASERDIAERESFWGPRDSDRGNERSDATLKSIHDELIGLRRDVRQSGGLA